MSYITVQNYNLEAAALTYSGVKTINKFGRNQDVDTAKEDIWSNGGIWAAPTAARTHDIASTSANDDGSPAGTGARTLAVYGLTDWDTAEVTETITLNGTTNVPTVNSYVIIHRMEVLTMGTAGPNVGDITATAQTDSTITAQIDSGEGQTQMAIYGLPSTQRGFLTHWYASVNKSGGSGSGGVDAALRENADPANSTGFLVKATHGILYAGGSVISHRYDPPKVFNGPCIIKIDAIGSNNNNDVSAGFDLIIKDN